MVINKLCTAITILQTLTMTIHLSLPVRFILPFYVFMILISIFFILTKEFPFDFLIRQSSGNELVVIV